MLETEKETTRKKGGKKILAVLVAIAMAVAVFIFSEKTRTEMHCRQLLKKQKHITNAMNLPKNRFIKPITNKRYKKCWTVVRVCAKFRAKQAFEKM